MAVRVFNDIAQSNLDHRFNRRSCRRIVPRIIGLASRLCLERLVKTLSVPYRSTALPVHIFNHISESHLDHRCQRAHAAASSQGLLEPPPGNASNASSSRARSQMVRLLIRLGWGILPSFTIASNRLGETPTYAAASDRDNPRGGSDSGSIEVGRCATWRVTSFGSRNKRAQGPDCSEAYSASLMQIGASSRPFLSKSLRRTRRCVNQSCHLGCLALSYRTVS